MSVCLCMIYALLRVGCCVALCCLSMGCACYQYDFQICVLHFDWLLELLFNLWVCCVAFICCFCVDVLLLLFIHVDMCFCYLIISVCLFDRCLICLLWSVVWLCVLCVCWFVVFGRVIVVVVVVVLIFLFCVALCVFV